MTSEDTLDQRLLPSGLFITALGIVLMTMMTPANGQGVASSEPEAVVLPHSEAFDLESSSKPGRTYHIEVALPSAPAPKEGYSVLYVLDGNARFPLLREARETLIRDGPSGNALPLLIVGIGYPGVERFALEQRALDYTPPGDGIGDGQGGAKDFLRFIMDTLQPAIAERYAVNDERTALLGHSYGALFALHVLQTCPECFRDYIAISPSLWWNQGQLLTEFGQLAQDATWCEALRGHRLLLGVGGDEQKPRPDEDEILSKLREQRAMVDNTIALGQLLDAQCSLLTHEQVVFAGEDHGSVMWPAARQVMKFLTTGE